MKANLWTLGSLRIRSLIRSTLALLALPMLLLAGVAQAQSSESLYGPHGINPMVVVQGHLGSCYFHSSVAALAHTNPDLLRSFITGDATSGYTVKFLSGVSERVEEQDVDFARSKSLDKSEGQWVAVLMRGYAQFILRNSLEDSVDKATTLLPFVKPMALQLLNQSGPLMLAYDRAIRVRIHQDGMLNARGLAEEFLRQAAELGIPEATVLPLAQLMYSSGFLEPIAQVVSQNGELFGQYKSMGQGGIPAEVLAVFLGKAAHKHTDDPKLVDYLTAVHSGELVMAAGTRTDGKKLPPEVLAQSSAKDWYHEAHAYTVLDYDAAQQIVTLRNPWGEQPGPDGVFRIPLAVFQQAYGIVDFSLSQPQPQSK
jgi:hypothetical protein